MDRHHRQLICQIARDSGYVYLKLQLNLPGWFPLLCGVQADADLVWRQEKSNLEAAAQVAQRRLQDLERVNAELQVHLDSQARAAAGEVPEKGNIPVMACHVSSHHLVCPLQYTCSAQTPFSPCNA